MSGTSPELVPHNLAEPLVGRERGPAEGPRWQRHGIADPTDILPGTGSSVPQGAGL